MERPNSEVVEKYFQVFKDIFSASVDLSSRQIVVQTGAAGYDLFDESVENEFGIGRIYLGRKVPRILRGRMKIHKSASGRYYKRVTIKN